MGGSLAVARRDWSWAAIAVVCATAGAVVPLFPPLAAVPFAAVAVAALLMSPIARGTFVVLGGIVAFQSSEGLGALKAAYLLGVGLACVGALLNLRSIPSALRRALTPIVIASGGLVLVTLASIIPALEQGATLEDWMRDASTYLLLALVPLFAVDLSNAAPRNIVRLLVIAGGAATVSFSVSWLERRGLASVSLDSFALSSIMLAAAFFAFAVASAFAAPRRRLLWLVTVAIAATLILVTGTRSGFMLLAAPLVIVLVPRFASLERFRELALGAAVVVALIALLFVSSGQLFPLERERVQERLTTGTTTVLRNPEFDASYRERQITTTLAWETFRSSPVVGVGPGHRFTYSVPYDSGSSRLRSPLVLDTALVTLAKFGLLGCIPIVFLLLGVFNFTHALLKRTRSRTALALTGYLGILALALVLASPFDDKGFSFALMMFLALGASEWRRAEGSSGHRATGTSGSAVR
jgi:O-antigen ligase